MTQQQCWEIALWSASVVGIRETSGDVEGFLLEIQLVHASG